MNERPTQTMAGAAREPRAGRLLRLALADIAESPRWALWVMLPAFVGHSVCLLLFYLGFDNRSSGLGGRVFDEAMARMVWFAVIPFLVGWVSVPWQRRRIDATTGFLAADAGLGAVLRYAVRWLALVLVLAVAVGGPAILLLYLWEGVLGWGEVLRAVRVAALSYYEGILAERQMMIEFSFGFQMLAIVGLIGVPYSFLWLRLGAGLPAIAAGRNPMGLRAAWQRTAGFGGALWRSSLGFLLIWCAGQVLALALAAESFRSAANLLTSPLAFGLRVLGPAAILASLNLLAAAVLVRLYLAAEPDRAAVFE